jgi:hypothetical protein
MLRTPGKEERAVWNDAEAPEPPANLTATLKGAVIHRFCETFREGEAVEERLARSFDDILSQRQAELVGRAFDIDRAEAVRTLLPLAQNYLASDVFRRVVTAQNSDPGLQIPNSKSHGSWSELRFRLRRPLGILTGTIDKLLITPARNQSTNRKAAKDAGLEVEIIDFKTNRFADAKATQTVRTLAVNQTTTPALSGQGVFNFETVTEEIAIETAKQSMADQINVVAGDYQLQMQGYALALRDLLPANVSLQSLSATLHFIDPNVEVSLAADLLEPETCAGAIDDAMNTIAALDGILDEEAFPPFPATHSRMCNFLELCPAGRDWLRSQ